MDFVSETLSLTPAPILSFQMFILRGSFLQHTMKEQFRNFAFFFFLNLGKVRLDEVIFKFFSVLKCHNPRSV